MARIRPICSVPGCGAPHRGHGYCSKHYQRWLYHGSTEPRRREPVPASEQAEFLRALVAAPWGAECVAWPYSRTEAGYGVATIDGVRIAAHRASCKMAHGEPPTPEHQAAHYCGKGHEGCVNPGHLRWATPAENSRDQIAHGTDPRGERNAAAVLAEQDVLAIYALKGQVMQKEIAARYGVSQPAVADIHRGGAWAWLTGATPFPGKVRGSRHHASKLAPDDVRTMRREAAGGEPYAEIAQRFGVSPQCVRSIVLRKSWAWLDDEQEAA